MEKTETTKTAKTETAEKTETATVKKPQAKKQAEKPKTEPADTQKVKSAVITGANPDVEFYRISDDLPVHLL